ncbi:hypothetical protein VNO77_44314 [Canavalia gladiata]|uniref:Secreted protein n=1 Tax=Canavalia gladiata TaxID=3824 RepID=A0AAN9PQM8_CANGL
MCQPAFLAERLLQAPVLSFLLVLNCVCVGIAKASISCVTACSYVDDSYGVIELKLTVDFIQGHLDKHSLLLMSGFWESFMGSLPRVLILKFLASRSYILFSCLSAIDSI